MDLGTVEKKLKCGEYQSVQEFVADVNLTFNNAMTHHSKDSVVANMAQTLQITFNKEMADRGHQNSGLLLPVDPNITRSTVQSSRTNASDGDASLDGHGGASLDGCGGDDFFDRPAELTPPDLTRTAQLSSLGKAQDASEPGPTSPSNLATVSATQCLPCVSPSCATMPRSFFAVLFDRFSHSFLCLSNSSCFLHRCFTKLAPWVVRRPQE
jgi:hypothetical protein